MPIGIESRGRVRERDKKKKKKRYLAEKDGVIVSWKPS